MSTIASYSAATVGSTSMSSSLDCHHPYYLHPSDNPGMQITTVILTENNYNQWNRSMEIALSSKFKLGFVDGSYVKPVATSPLFVHWIRCNNMVTAWILNSVSTEIRSSIVYIPSARDIWLDLEVRYAQSNVPKLFHLRKEIAHLTQGAMSVCAYFTKFRTLHDELECLYTKPRCTCTLCTCSVNTKLSDLEQSIQLTQFLMGLNDTFTAIRGQILMMKPLPSLNQSYAILLQEESQREVHHSLSNNSENIAMAVKSNYPTKQPRGGQNAFKKTNDSSVVCDYCHMSGHLRDKCYCIHGYPSWHKLFGKPKPKPKFLTNRNSVVANVTSVGSGLDNVTTSAGLQLSQADNGLNLSEGQCHQLINMLQKNLSTAKSQTQNQIASGNTVSTDASSWLSSLDTFKFSGMAAHVVNYVHALDKTLSQNKWIVDTGATDHITPFLHLLQDVQPCHTTLQLPNGATATISHVGNLMLSSSLKLTNVLCVPSFAYNLLSISKLLIDTSYQVTFLADKCFLQDENLHNLLELGKEDGGLYMLTTSDTHKESASANGNQSNLYSSGLFVANVHNSDVWHARLGHAPADIVHLLPVKCDKKVLDICDSCFFAKQTRLKFSSSVSESENLFDLVHADLWGPYRFKTHGSCNFFLTLVEDKSRTTWIYLVSDKATVPVLIQEFITLIQNQFLVTIKVLRTDNGTKFVNQTLAAYLSSLGIIHQSSCVYTPQQNGLVERKHRHLLNCARALRFHAGLPIIFWGDCLMAAAYLINRTPTAVLDHKSPYEILYQSVPEYDQLRVFGCLCYATIVPQPPDKFAPRSVKGVFLGYPYAKKGYKVLNLDTKQIFVSRDVRFVETIFPFKQIEVTPPHALFPPSSVYIEDDPLHYESIPSVSPTNANVDEIASIESFAETSDLACVQPQPSLGPDRALERPRRQRHIPVKFHDYTGLPPSLSNMTVATSVSSQSTDTHGISVQTPQHYKEAVLITEWCEAMNVELAALEANNTWDVVPLPPNKKPVGCKWLYKVKYLPNGQVDRFKARLVAKGFTQTVNMDYFETFAPVAKMTTFRLILAIAAMKDWCITQLDVTNAFLHGMLDEEVYMSVPPGFSIPSHVLDKYPGQKLVCRLLKSLYGLKQAPRQWFIALSSALLSFGFVQTNGDSSLFVFARGDDLILLLIYVDDMIMTGNNAILMSQVTEFLSTHFKIKDLGPLSFFLGIQVTKTTDGFFMNQQKYVMDILKDFVYLKPQSAVVPMEQHHELLKDTDSPLLQDVTSYRRLVGKLIYLTISRPDLAYSVHVLAQFMNNPHVTHWHAALKLIRYLSHTTEQGLFYAKHANPVLTAYCDADWGSCNQTRQSLTGFCVTFGNTLVSWRCKKQQTVSRSTAEAEYRSMADTSCEITWLIALLSEMHLTGFTPVPLFCDNQSALYIASNPVFHERTKHIEIDCHLVRQKFKAGLISPQHISTHDQPADLFTKALASSQMRFLLSKLGVCFSLPTPHLRGAVEHNSSAELATCHS